MKWSTWPWVSCLVCVFGTSTYAAEPVTPVIDTQQVSFNIPSEPLNEALNEFSRQTHLRVANYALLGQGITSPRLVGSFTPNEALTRLLANTKLRFEYLDQESIAILPIDSGDKATSTAPSSNTTLASRSDPADSVPMLAEGPQGTSRVPSPTQETDVTRRSRETNSRDSNSSTLQQIVVTGSRLQQPLANGSQKVNVYTRESIEQSGQTTVADFLNTIPQVSTVMDQSGNQANGTSVRLHGLPLGTTLVLIDGRRVGAPGGFTATSNIFDLSNIPLSAVERVDVVPVGSSAVYGSDAIAGVVDIVLRKNFSGFEGSVKYGGASATNSTTTSLAWGSQWDGGAFTAVGSYMTTRQLIGSDRTLTANGNYAAYGGPDVRYDFANPGNVFSIDGSNLRGLNASYAAVPVGFKGPPSLAEFAATVGTLNKFTYQSAATLIPRSDQKSVLLSAHQDFTPSIRLFGEMLYSDIRRTYENAAPLLYGFPGYQSFTVAASNPYNPFGQTIGVGYLFPDRSSSTVRDITFVQPTFGLRGSFLQRWNWEISGSWSDETDKQVADNQYANTSAAIQNALNSSNPVTALDPFTAGAPGSPQLLRSLFYNLIYRYKSTRAGANAFINGPIVSLPSGDVDVVLGTEYLRDRLTSSQYDPTTPLASNPLFTDSSAIGRNSSAFFAEARIPMLPKRPDGSDALALNLAARIDHYSDMGSKTTPQVGIHWRPIDTLVFRGMWGKAFKAPSLFELHEAQQTFPAPLVDPVTNQQIVPAVTSGGNLKLNPEQGQSHSFGVEYHSQEIPGLQLGISQWRIDETNSIQSLTAQAIVNNEDLFSGSVTRASNCASGHPCPIVAVKYGYVNFGNISVAGIDYDANYKLPSTVGVWSASLQVAEIYRYTAAFLPGLAPTDRLGVANDADYSWAPRWKGTVALGWVAGPLAAAVTGRYTGKYRDYEPLTDSSYRTLGNFWLFDVNARLEIGRALGCTAAWARGSFVELGGINILDRAPQFSTVNGSLVGYDYLQADMRGRFLYARFGIRL